MEGGGQSETETHSATEGRQQGICPHILSDPPSTGRQWNGSNDNSLSSVDPVSGVSHPNQQDLGSQEEDASVYY